MELSLVQQLRELAVGLLLGGALGLLMEPLRLLRRHIPRWMGAVWDVLFLVFAAICVFVFSQGSGAGGRLFFPAATAAGLTLYLYILSDAVFSALLRAEAWMAPHWEKVGKILEKVRKKWKNIGNHLKKTLSK